MLARTPFEPPELASVAQTYSSGELYALCIFECRPGGIYLEFGVGDGRSLRVIRYLAPPDNTVYGFDSFAGLPEPWNGLPAGWFKTEKRISLTNTVLVEGLFQQTLPAFLKQHPDPVSFVNIDCDLYCSTKTVLMLLADRIGPGTTMRFDEMVGYPSWRQHEYKAFVEFIAATGKPYAVIGRYGENQVGIKFL